jgi:hypothetical protein
MNKEACVMMLSKEEFCSLQKEAIPPSKARPNWLIHQWANMSNN